jgi:hypothetical protein
MRLLMLMMLAAAVCLGPAQAASDGAGDAAKNAAAKAREIPNEIHKAVPKTPERDRPDDLVSCKRDAGGMHGPERARFMTECIRKR